MNLNPDQINQLIRERRSVFTQYFTSESVDDNIIHQMIENARWAPTHKLTEPWRFIVFTGDGLRQLAEAQAEVYKDVTMRDGSFKEDKYKSLKTKPLLSSHIIAVCMHRDLKHSLPRVEELGAVFCAIQNMQLTATAYGIGCYLSTGGITYFKEARTVFDLGEEDELVGFLHVGVPKSLPAGSKRKPVDEISNWVR